MTGKSIISILIAVSLAHGTPRDVADSTGGKASDRQIIGMPWLSGSSDQGIAAGFSIGMADSPVYVVYLVGYASARRYASLSLKGESELGDRRIAGRISLTSINRKVYPDGSGVPDPSASAQVGRITANISLLKALRSADSPQPGTGSRLTGSKLDKLPSTGQSIFEIGPDLLLDVSRSKDAVDASGNSPDLESIPRFRSGSTAQIGLRCRYRTTSAQRPVDGLLVDAAARLGRSGGDLPGLPDPDFSNELSAAAAIPLNSHFRLYLRGQWQYQLNSPLPVRNSLGADKTLRGQPDQRDIGRRVLSGRAQLHLTTLHKWTFPSRVLHYLWTGFPVLPLDVESVFFADIGKAGDPDYGWRHSRQGFGYGLRFVAPPELVLFLDIAKSPGGDVRFYIGTGETL